MNDPAAAVLRGAETGSACKDRSGTRMTQIIQIYTDQGGTLTNSSLFPVFDPFLILSLRLCGKHPYNARWTEKSAKSSIAFFAGDSAKCANRPLA